VIGRGIPSISPDDTPTVSEAPAAANDVRQVIPPTQLALGWRFGSVVVVRSNARLVNPPPENVPKNLGLGVLSWIKVKVMVPLRLRFELV
jgi:hypothetical protein